MDIKSKATPGIFKKRALKVTREKAATNRKLIEKNVKRYNASLTSRANKQNMKRTLGITNEIVAQKMPMSIQFISW